VFDSFAQHSLPFPLLFVSLGIWLSRLKRHSAFPPKGRPFPHLPSLTSPRPLRLSPPYPMRTWLFRTSSPYWHASAVNPFPGFQAALGPAGSHHAFVDDHSPFFLVIRDPPHYRIFSPLDSLFFPSAPGNSVEATLQCQGPLNVFTTEPPIFTNKLFISYFGRIPWVRFLSSSIYPFFLDCKVPTLFTPVTASAPAPIKSTRPEP